MKIYEEIVEELNNRGFIDIVKKEDGFLQLNDSLCTTFSPFFANSNNLKKFSFDFLIHDYIHYINIYYGGIEEDIKKILYLYNKAKESNPIKTFNYIANLQEESVSTGNKHWSAVKEARLPNEEYDYIVKLFSNIEEITEGILKDEFKKIIYLQDISIGSVRNLEDIDKMTFGNLYKEIVKNQIIDTVMNNSELIIDINQWRNIACHKDYKIVGGKITCKYGAKKDKDLIIDSKEDLYKIARKIYELSSIFNFSFKFFTYDNIEEVKKEYVVNNDTENQRIETDELLITTEFYFRGLEILNIDCSEKKVSIVVKDLVETENDESKRIIFTSQFLLKVFLIFNKDENEIVYTNSKNEKKVSMCANRNVFYKIINGIEETSYLAQKVEFKFYK